MNSTNKLFWLPRFERDYKKLSKEDKKKVNKTLLKMEEDLNYPSLVVKKLEELPTFGKQELHSF